LRPKTLDEAQIALFIRKLPRHISAMINTKSFDTPKDMIRRCNQLWATQTPRGGRRRLRRRCRGYSRPVATLLSPERPAPPVPLPWPPQDARRRQDRRPAAAARQPPGQPKAAATTACASTTPALATRPTSARGAALCAERNY
jgi:hypothetical protein